MRIFSTFFLAVFATVTFAQHFHCGDALLKHNLKKKHPQIEELINATFENAQQSFDFREDTLEIPVVVHVLYNNDAQNLSDEVILSQIDVLNKDFSRQNEDASNTRDVFLDVAASPNIKFKLTKTDPDGNPTTGITRTETSRTTFLDIDLFALLAAVEECGDDFDCVAEQLGEINLDLMKSSDTDGVDPWDTQRYLNIWVCNMAIDALGQELPLLLGFAYPPVEAPNWPSDQFPENLDDVTGVVIQYSAFGLNNPSVGTLAGISDRGRTCTHEIGHYLGLRHVWGDGDCTMDDGIEDTPTMESNSQPQEAENLPTCEELHEKDTCLDDALPDMIENYMDYSLESCQNMFSQGQVNIMRAMLTGPRSGLLEQAMVSTEDELEAAKRILLNTTTQHTVYINESYAQSKYIITSINGAVIATGVLEGTLDVSILSNGVYTISAMANGKTKTEQFFVQK